MSFPEVLSLIEKLKMAGQLAELLTVIDQTFALAYRPHDYCEDVFYMCPKHPEAAEYNAYFTAKNDTDCNCGADDHNAKVDALKQELMAILEQPAPCAATPPLLDNGQRDYFLEVL